MKDLLLRLIYRAQRRLYEQKDDTNDLDKIKQIIDKIPVMLVNVKPEPNKDVKVHVMQKTTKKMAACIGMWDGESWRIHTQLGYAPMPISLEVLGWEEK